MIQSIIYCRHFAMLEREAKVKSADMSDPAGHLTIDLPEIQAEDVIESTRHGPQTPEQIRTLQPELRVSYYIQAWQEMLDTVYALCYVNSTNSILTGRDSLSKEDYLFTKLVTAANILDESLEILLITSNFSVDPARYLFVRLFIRKNGYFRIRNIGYERDVPDLQAACDELCSHLPLPLADSVSPNQHTSRSPSPSPKASTSKLTIEQDLDEETDDPNLGVFAEDARNLAARADIIELCGMLSVEELKGLAKNMNISPPKEQKKGKYVTAAWTRPVITAALLKNTANQSTLFSSFSVQTKKKAAVCLNYDKNGIKTTQSDLLVRKLLKMIGPVIKIDPSIMQLFTRLHLIFHRCAPPSNSHSMTAALLARFEKRAYPTYEVSRGFTVFSSRKVLLEYERAVNLERQMEESLEYATASFGASRPSSTTDDGAYLKDKIELDEQVAEGQKSRSVERKQRWKKVQDLFDTIWNMWLACIAAEERKASPTIDTKQDRLTYYKRRFNPGWPLTRAVHKGTAVLGVTKQHDKEAACLRALLGQTYFRRGRRGQWWDRLALIFMEHGVRSPVERIVIPGSDDEDDEIIEVTKGKLSQAECRKQALEICWNGLEDPWTHLVERHALQRRIARLESLMKVPKDKRHVFTEQLNKATDFEIKGKQLGDKITGKKSHWQSTLPDKEESVSVEELSLEHYREEGWKGMHSENSILTCLFGLLFWDVLFHPVDGAFETAYQSEPIDLRTDAFSIVRADLVAQRLDAIRKGHAGQIIQKVDEQERERGTWCVGVRWDSFTSEDLQDFARCMGPEALCVICRVFAEDYEHRVGGVPDLFLWKPEDNCCKFVEVKGPGDTLSRTQKVWIDLLLSAGIPVEKCNVRSSLAPKRKRPDDEDDSKPPKDLKAYAKRARTSQAKA